MTAADQVLARMMNDGDHGCNAYCRGELHADIGWSLDDPISEAYREAIGRFYGIEVVEVRLAPEAPPYPPSGLLPMYSDSWTYRFLYLWRRP